MVRAVQQIEALYARLQKAPELVKEGKVHPVLNMENHYFVESTTGKGGYIVNGSSNCPDAQERTDIHHGHCKHMLSAQIFKENPQTEEPKEPKPKARKQRALGNGDEAAAMANAGHWIPDQPSPGDDGRSLQEQVADLF